MMWIPTKLGTQVRLPDGREGTVVFNSPIGVGIKWGLHDPPPEDFDGTSGGLMDATKPTEWPWRPDALLRDPEEMGDTYDDMECVGEQCELIRYGLEEKP